VFRQGVSKQIFKKYLKKSDGDAKKVACWQKNADRTVGNCHEQMGPFLVSLTSRCSIPPNIFHPFFENGITCINEILLRKGFNVDVRVLCEPGESCSAGCSLRWNVNSVPGTVVSTCCFRSCAFSIFPMTTDKHI